MKNQLHNELKPTKNTNEEETYLNSEMHFNIFWVVLKINKYCIYFDKSQIS